MHKDARAQVRIFDTTQIWDVCQNCGYLDIVTLFRGSIKHKQGILGYRIAPSNFDNDYLLGNIDWYRVASYVNMRTCETCVLTSDTRRILRSH